MPSIYAKNNESINTNYSVTTNDENICPNQTLTPKRHSSSKVALSLSSSSPFSATATNKSRINNKKVTATAKGVNNISPKKRAPRVAKLAALYDDGQFKQSPHRGQTSLGVSGPSPIRSSKKKPAVVQSYDDKREFNGILQSPSQLSSIKDITNKSDIVNQASKATMEIIQKSASANEKDEKEANSGQHTKSSFNRAISQHTPSVAKMEETSSSSAGNALPNFLPPAVKVASQLILLLLSLYEVQHHYHFSSTATIFDAITELTGWSELFHVAFVLAFFVRALVASYVSTRRILSMKKIKNGKVSLVQTILLFGFIVSCWLALLPIFSDNQFCFFVERVTTQSKPLIKISNPRYSMLDLLAKNWYRRIKFLVKSKIKGRVMKEIQRALFRPFTIHGKLKKLFTIIRWSKFIGPLVGTLNKFRGHVLDMIKKRQQHITSKAAQQRWSDLLDSLSKQSKLERAVLKLQKQFREKRELKAKRRFNLMSPVRDKTSNKQMANKICKILVEEQKHSRSKLERMEILNSQREMRRQVSQDERRDITKHKESERMLKKRLLLSPKTSFAVAWKYFTVACIALELIHHMFAPVLSGELKKMPLDKFLLKVLNASSSSNFCGGKPGTKQAVSAPSIFIPVINNLDDITCTDSLMKQTWLVSAHIIATVIPLFVNTIFFLDVFITFFTGELSSTTTGMIVPKPFFTRYILPGVGLQLIVNPTMFEISRLVKQMIVHAMHIGPCLCSHLFLGCVPFAVCCYDLVLDVLFDFVEKQNRDYRMSKRKTKVL